MPGYLKTSLTLAQARQIVTDRYTASDTTVFSNDTTPRFYSVPFVLLHSAPSAGKKLSFVKTQRHDARKTKFLEVEKYHRFVLLGSPSTEEVFAIFTDTASDSHNLFRYQSNLKPGVLVSVLNPQVEGLLRASNTTLLSSIEPLIPNVNQPVLNLTLPHSLEMASFRYFEFVSTSVRIKSATATENVCPGNFCDAQMGLQNCGCLAVASKKSWALTLVIESDELAPLEDVDHVSITFKSVTDIFVTAARQQLSPNATDFDPFAMDTAVVDMCTRINGNGGFIIKGWFKPSMTEEGATQDVKRIHICQMTNNNALTDEITALKY